MKHKLAIIGLGYVGLPLARLFATKYPVVGFDIKSKRIAELNDGIDFTLEIEEDLLKSVLLKENPFNSEPIKELTSEQLNNKTNEQEESAGSQVHKFTDYQSEVSPSLPVPKSPSPKVTVKNGLYCTSDFTDIKNANIYIITVPTPVDKNNKPDLTPLYKASETVGKVLKIGDIVIYESTVYPGATEEECIPVLEKISGLKFNEDFFAGYSPERINPGDKDHTVEKILKVTSGSTPEIGEIVDQLYKSVITAGTHLAPCIKVAEAAKVIENSQRDINIAFVNELAKIFNLMNIDTHAVLKAAGTKWNFLPFKPGLVGGHCIGVDPYYLAQRAQEFGYHPEIILAGRRLNDSMGEYVASQVVKALIKKNINVAGAKLLMLGITFKENCPDVRNTKIVEVIRNLEEYGIQVTLFDPWANPAEVKHEYNLDCFTELPTVVASDAKQFQSEQELLTTSKLQNLTTLQKYDAVVLGVAHHQFLDLDLNLHLKENSVVYDVKGMLKNYDARL